MTKIVQQRSNLIMTEAPRTCNKELTATEALIHQKLSGRSIVLIGIMGAGKSSIGRRLAARLDMPFTDADQEIEKAADRTIEEIFEEHGEVHFREGEARVINRLLHEKSYVLATGGGAYMNEATREIIRKLGISVWLKAEFDVLMARVRRKNNRPLLQQPDPESVMRKLLKEREPFYAQADIAITSDEGPHELVVEKLITSLAHWLQEEQNQ